LEIFKNKTRFREKNPSLDTQNTLVMTMGSMKQLFETFLMIISPVFPMATTDNGITLLEFLATTMTPVVERLHHERLRKFHQDWPR
jgi:hypothetical protein